MSSLVEEINTRIGTPMFLYFMNDLYAHNFFSPRFKCLPVLTRLPPARKLPTWIRLSLGRKWPLALIHFLPTRLQKRISTLSILNIDQLSNSYNGLVKISVLSGLTIYFTIKNLHIPMFMCLLNILINTNFKKPAWKITFNCWGMVRKKYT